MAKQQKTGTRRRVEAKRRIIDIDIEVGRRVRMLRVELGIGQGELADALNVSFQQLQKYEIGLNRISAGKLIQIAEALRVPLASIFEGIADDIEARAGQAALKKFKAVQDFAATDEGRRLIRGYLAIKEKKSRRNLLRMIESFGRDI